MFRSGRSGYERGYRLDASEIEVDAIEFAERAARGSDALTAGRAEEASKELREALQLWRGPALAELSTLPGLRAQAVRLDELHTKVRGDRVEADLASGQPHSVIGELESLIAVNPMKEHLWALLALPPLRAGPHVDFPDPSHPD